MIETKKILDDPLIILHKVCSFSNLQETVKDVEAAVEVIEKALNNRDAFNLLLDFSGLDKESDYTMAAHREWALGFKEKVVVDKRVQKVAVFGKDSPKFNAEKEYMEDEKHRWFTDYEEALGWLKVGNS